MIEGGCMCGAVRYSVHGPVQDIVACHCRQCRRMSGHYYAATAAYAKDVTVHGPDALQWYRSSTFARRGFCRHCGSSLFYDHDNNDLLSIAAGSLDRTAGLGISAHIFVEEMGEYYRIDDAIPQMTAAQWLAKGREFVHWHDDESFNSR